jgi:hypothetical protein
VRNRQRATVTISGAFAQGKAAAAFVELPDRARAGSATAQKLPTNRFIVEWRFVREVHEAEIHRA